MREDIMLLKSAKINNYRNFDVVTIPFEVFSVLVGPNNIGKSSILQALEYVFTPVNPRNITITKSDFFDPSKKIMVEVVLGDLDEKDKAAFYHDDGLINAVDNTITIRFESSWSSVDQDVENECYFVRGDLPVDQQRMADFSTRYKPFLPYYIISSERSALHEVGISKNRDLGRVLRVYSSDYLKPLPTLLAELKAIFEILDKGNSDWVGFPADIYENSKKVAAEVFAVIPPNFVITIVGKEISIIDNTLEEVEKKWSSVENNLNDFTTKHREVLFLDHFLQLIEKMPILIKRAKTQLSLYELRSGMLAERKFEEMNLGFKQIFDDMLPGQKVGVNLFSIQDDELISQISVDIDDQSILTTGSGYQSMFVIGLKLVRMLAQLRTSGATNIRNFIVAIEEPENHLHPHMQRHLIDFVRKLQYLWKKEGYQLQVILTTHSPSVVSRFAPWELILLQKEKGSVFAYKWQMNQVELMAKELEPDEKKKSKKATQLQLFTEFFMEHFADVFFSACVIIVEGETEQGAIPIWAKKLSPPLDFNNLGVCLINPRGDNIVYAMKVLDTFNISHAVLYDRGDNHAVIGVSRGCLFPSKNNEFEDDLIESANLKSLINAAMNSAFGNTNDDRAAWIKGNIPECNQIQSLEEVILLIVGNLLSPGATDLLKNQVKSWLKKSKTMFLGKALASDTEEGEIPQYIRDALGEVRKIVKEKMD
jgi:predicted ATP-dependent endonuclease of OLD family